MTDGTNRNGRPGLLERVRRKIDARRFAARRKRVPTARVPQEALQEEGYASQWGQDKFVVEALFGRRRGGVFFDIGANDGVTFSNTLYMERELGWSGVAVEPLPRTFAKLDRARTCHKLNGCVADYHGEARFMALDGHCEMLSGRVDTYDASHVERIESEIAAHGGKREMITVPCFTFEEVVERFALPRVDFLSLDTEGGEFDILRSIDLQRIEVSVICVENNYGDLRLFRHLRAAGYELAAILGDEIYVRPGGTRS